RATATRLGQAGAVVVQDISAGSPAEAAGLRRGDIILELDGKPVTGVGGLQAAIEVATTDKPITLTVDRDGQRRQVPINPHPQPPTFGQPPIGPPRLPRVPGPPLLPGRPIPFDSEPSLEPASPLEPPRPSRR